MITTNVFQRTFRIKHGNSTGTCFVIDHEQRQYLVTAKHVVEGMYGVGRPHTLEIHHESQWKTLDVSLVGTAPDDVDIAVFAPTVQLAPTHELEPTLKGAVVGQDMYFLGYPYGLHTEVGPMNRDFPLPLVKKATLSALLEPLILLDGHNNSGFSGGPVVFAPPGQPATSFRVGAVISGYRPYEEPIYLGDTATPLRYRYNTGIIIAYRIKGAVDAISNNPIGLDVSGSS